MVTRRMVRFFAISLVWFASVLVTEVRAQLAPALIAPLSCTLSLGGAQLTIETVPGPSSEVVLSKRTFPYDVPCTGGTGICSAYTYRYTYAGGNISQSFLSVSSDVAIFEASPSAVIEAAGSGICGSGDSSTKVGLNVCEQRQVRFNEASSTVNATVVVTRAATRVSTAGAKKGNAEAYCLIQGPGVPGGAFTSVSLTRRERVAGGKCDADWSFNPAGIVTGVSTPTPTCVSGDGLITANSAGGSNQPVQDSSGATITTGTGTSSCRVVGGRSYCVCTAAPCP